MQTRGEQMLALRQSRLAAAPAFLRGGFRPFFFGGALWSVVALSLWLMSLAQVLTLPSAFEPLAWHRHEMLFGFVGAIVAGFLLTAIPNWTGRLPIAGWPLFALFSLWVAARIAVLTSGWTSLGLAALLDIGFYLTLAAVCAREVFAANNRNLPVVGLVLLFGAVNAWDYAGVAGLVPDPVTAAYAGVAVIVILISLIGGRIVPSFTRNWLSKRGVKEGLPKQPGRYDEVTILATATALLLWLTGPAGAPAAFLFLIAAALQLIRLARWKGYHTFADPLVIVLHVGYLWIPVGLALLGISMIDAGVPISAAIHALTAGAMATMILAVMTRATLGHTGRELRAGVATVLIFVLVTAGAVVRVTAPLGLLDYTLAMKLSAAAWGGAFLTFLAAYGPILCRPRLGE